jgi:hypothetical protein
VKNRQGFLAFPTPVAFPLRPGRDSGFVDRSAGYETRLLQKSRFATGIYSCGAAADFHRFPFLCLFIIKLYKHDEIKKLVLFCSKIGLYCFFGHTNTFLGCGPIGCLMLPLKINGFSLNSLETDGVGPDIIGLFSIITF